MEKDPDRRYQSGGDLAGDLRRYLNRFAISARRAGPIARTVKWCRRRPAVAALLGAVVLLGVAAGLLAYGVHRSNVAMLEMQRQQAIEDAMLTAMSGDWGRAEEAIAQAELHGASPGRIQMVQGLLALQQGQDREAIKHSEQAVRLMPTSVAARGMLAYAYLNDRQIEHYYATLLEMEQLVPSTAEDYLFKGMAEGQEKPQLGLPSLDEAVRRRDSIVARLIRAEVRLWQAALTGNLGDIQMALDDAGAAKTMLPGNVLALRVHLDAELVAAMLLEDAGQTGRREAALAEAEGDMQALEAFPRVRWARSARAKYFDTLGQHDAGLAEWREFVECGGNPRYLAEALYRQGAFGEALEILDRTPAEDRDNIFLTHRALILAELPDGYARALEACRELAARKPTGWWVLYPNLIFVLLGREPEAAAEAREARHRVTNLPVYLRDWYAHLADYQCQSISSDELLATTAEDRGRRCEAHFHIGVRRLADGDRDGAAQHFRAATATHVYDFFEFTWSQNFLARLEQDPTWPPWIPLKEGTERPRNEETE